MNQQRWLKLTLFISLILLGTTVSKEALYLNRPFKWTPTLKLPNQSKAADSSYFWDATISGNSRKISDKTKDALKSLGLAHIYTPSGLHLSLILNPLFFIIKAPWIRLILLTLIFILTSIYLPGWAAIKRVIELKLAKVLLTPIGIESKWIFIIVMILDLIFGTYQDGAMSFCFSFLFLSLLYAKMSFIVAAWWFFIAQIIIAIFLEQSFFITNIVITPILTLIFSSIFPILLVARTYSPFYFIGDFLSENYLALIQVAYKFSNLFPKIEATPIILLIIGFILFRQFRLFLVFVFLFSGSVNLGENKFDSNYLLRKYFIVYENKEKCKMAGGFEKCSYRSRSTKKRL